MELLWLQIQVWMHSPYAPLAIPLGILLLYLFWNARQKRAEMKQRMEQDASSLGMKYTAPKGQGFSVGLGSGAASVSEGSHTFSGRTNGVEWTVNSLVLMEPGTNSSRRMGKQYTRWSSKDFKTGNQDYLILMDLPENMRKEAFPQPKGPAGTGFFASLANSMANMAFGMYANGYFGKSQMEGTVFDQTHRLQWPTGVFAEHYMVFSNNEPLSKKLVDAETMDYILKNRPFEFSFLINSNGIMASCPLFMVEPAQIQTISKFCSELVGRIRKK